VNSIVWGNTPDQILHIEDTMTVTFSDIQGGGFVGTGNINEDPHLGPLADNGGFVKTHSLALLSPAIDAGNPDPEICPSTDARGFPRPIDGNGDGSAICDMGAYESGFSRLYLPLVLR